MNMNRRRAPNNVIAATTLRSLVLLQLMLPLLLLVPQPAFADATILTDHFADIEIDSDDCSLVQCSAPPLCPADSRLRETSADVDDLDDDYDELATSDPFDGVHIEALGPIEFSSESKGSTTTTATTTSNIRPSTAAGAAGAAVAAGASRAARVKRSLQRLQQRIWKRDLDILRMGLDAADEDGADGASSDATLDVEQRTCCPEYECVCNDCSLSERSASRCTVDEVALEMSSASGEPGSCCAHFECVKRWQCDAATRSDEYWTSECTKCRCFGGEELCADLCDKSSSSAQQQQRHRPHQHHQHHQHEHQHQHQRDEARASSCYSDYLDKLMFEGETWLEDAACSECTCQEGEKMCIANFCAAAECESPKKVEGQCCPVCEEGAEGRGVESPKEKQSEGSEKAPGAPDSTSHSTPSESSTEAEVNATQNTEAQIETTTTTTTTTAATTAAAAIINDSLDNKNLADQTTASSDTSTEAMTLRTSVSVAAVVVDEDADESAATKATTMSESANFTLTTSTKATTTTTTTRTTTRTTTGGPAANETATTTPANTRTTNESFATDTDTDTESNNKEIVSSRSSATTSEASSTESHSVTSGATPTTGVTAAAAAAGASAGTTIEGPETKYGELQTDAASASSEGTTTATTATRTTGNPATTSYSVTTASDTAYSFGPTSPSAAIGSEAPLDTTVTQSIVSRFRVTAEPRFSAPATSSRSDPRPLLPHDVYTHGLAVSSTTTSSYSNNLNAVPLLKTPPTDVIEESSTSSNTSHNILHIFHKVDAVLIVGLALGALLSLALGLLIRHNRNKTKAIYSTIPSSETSLSQTSTNTMFTV